jgi:hypothetical protein
VIEVSAKNTTPTTGTATDCDEPRTTINVCLHRNTHTRLTAYKNYNPLANKTFDEAVNEILDSVGFPEADVFENPAFPVLSYTGDQPFSMPGDD